ncbi:DUF397 domain-containing protein [Streptomyces sp. NPDC006992]|uniref:DUF397 domain-containing protein n=1 Tax=Streptomyces sp. NPDC006992 TaxID=3155601 RepID=UPI0033FCFEEB
MTSNQPHLNSTPWHKGSHSNGDGGEGVEVAVPAHGGDITARDTKAGPGGHVLTLPAPQWAASWRRSAVEASDVGRRQSWGICTRAVAAGHVEDLKEIEPFSD